MPSLAGRRLLRHRDHSVRFSLDSAWSESLDLAIQAELGDPAPELRHPRNQRAGRSV
jgi:hypothetical protein